MIIYLLYFLPWIGSSYKKGEIVIRYTNMSWVGNVHAEILKKIL